MRSVSTALTCLASLTACAGDAPRGADVTVTDSAGMEIVTSVAPAWKRGRGWRVDTVPLLSIGDRAESGAAFFQGIGGARLLSDGRIAVANGVERSVVYFDAAGERVGRLGGEGEGPGEFRGISLVGALGDSVLAWDPQLDRATLITPDGAVARTFRFAERDTSTISRFGFTPVDLSADGTVLLAGRVGASNSEKGGVRRDPVPLRRGFVDGTVGRQLVVVPGSENVVVTGTSFVTMFERPFGLRTTTVASGSHLMVSTGEFDGVMRFDSVGTLASVWRIDRPRRAVAETDVAVVLAMRVEQLNQLPRAFAEAVHAALEGVGYPGVLPTFDAMLRDETGALWLRNDVGPVQRDSIPRQWTVFDPRGTWLGEVQLPRRVEVQQITRDRILGIWKDDDEVEHVRLYRLRR